MSWNNVMPASAINIPTTEYPPEGAFVAPKSSRGRKPSKWQLVRDTTPGGFGDCLYGVDDGVHTVWWDSEKKAKAALAYARAFDYIPNDYMRNA